MRRWAGSIVVAVATLAGCGAGGGSDAVESTTTDRQGVIAPVRDCAQVFVDGAIPDEKAFDQMCSGFDGKSPRVYGTIVTACDDGRELASNHAGWGYVGEPWHRYKPRADKAAPLAEQRACAG